MVLYLLGGFHAKGRDDRQATLVRAPSLDWKVDHWYRTDVSCVISVSPMTVAIPREFSIQVADDLGNLSHALHESVVYGDKIGRSDWLRLYRPSPRHFRV
jgi:hypothetical protein